MIEVNPRPPRPGYRWRHRKQQRKAMAQILFIDDDAGLRRTARSMLEAGHHSVLEAENGRDGLKLFESRAPDVVITDVIMPDMDGIETLRAIKQRDPAARVIAISGGDMARYILRCMRVFGAAEALAKPFDGRQLLDAVGRVLAHQG